MALLPLAASPYSLAGRDCAGSPRGNDARRVTTGAALAVPSGCVLGLSKSTTSRKTTTPPPPQQKKNKNSPLRRGGASLQRLPDRELRREPCPVNVVRELLQQQKPKQVLDPEDQVGEREEEEPVVKAGLRVRGAGGRCVQGGARELSSLLPLRPESSRGRASIVVAPAEKSTPSAMAAIVSRSHSKSAMRRKALNPTAPERRAVVAAAGKIL